MKHYWLVYGFLPNNQALVLCVAGPLLSKQAQTLCDYDEKKKTKVERILASLVVLFRHQLRKRLDI